MSVTSGGLFKRKPDKQKRSFDVAMNITPMSDVMASILCFLMLSASWVTLAKLDANLPSTADASTSMANEPDEEDKFQLQVLLTKDKRIMIDRGNDLEPIEAVESSGTKEYNWVRYDAVLKEVRLSQPDHRDVTLSADPEVDYEFVISAMDTSIANDLPNVSLAAAAAKGVGE